MIDCEFKPYCTDDCESCNYAKALKQRQELDEVVQVAKAVICKAFEPLLDAMEKVIEKLLGRKNRNEKNQRNTQSCKKDS
jgi:hypothetical protein